MPLTSTAGKGRLQIIKNSYYLLVESQKPETFG